MGERGLGSFARSTPSVPFSPSARRSWQRYSSSHLPAARTDTAALAGEGAALGRASLGAYEIVARLPENWLTEQTYPFRSPRRDWLPYLLRGELPKCQSYARTCTFCMPSNPAKLLAVVSYRTEAGPSLRSREARPVSELVAPPPGSRLRGRRRCPVLRWKSERLNHSVAWCLKIGDPRKHHGFAFWILFLDTPRRAPSKTTAPGLCSVTDDSESAVHGTTMHALPFCPLVERVAIETRHWSQ